ncbi:hypothetical protein STEG23_018043, partial [Scotinomys teguina]
WSSLSFAFTFHELNTSWLRNMLEKQKTRVLSIIPPINQDALCSPGDLVDAGVWGLGDVPFIAEESITHDVALRDGCSIRLKAVPPLFQLVALMPTALARSVICLCSQDRCTEQPETNTDKVKQSLEGAHDSFEYQASSFGLRLPSEQIANLVTLNTGCSIMTTADVGEQDQGLKKAVAQQLGALAALPEDPGSIPTIHMAAHKLQ